MKFICNKTEISEAIGNVSRAVSQKSTIPALEGIKVRVSDGSVELTAYNLEMGIRTSIKANTDGEGEFVVSTRLFSEFTRRMSEDEIAFTIDDNLVISISSSTTECSFPAMSASEYPELPKVDSARSFSVKQSVLKSMINMTNYATSLIESKPVLTGELFDIEDGSFNMVAIDGFRLAIRNEMTDCNEKYHFVVPKKALLEVSTLIKDDDDKFCTVCTNDRHIIFEIGNVFVISRLLEGVFHNYKLSIPSGCKTEVIISKRDFTTCLERCSLLIDDKNKSPIRCEVGNGVMKISCKTGIGKINDVISADISGETVTIGFNNKLILEALRAAEGDKIRLRFNGAMKVIEILPLEGESFIFLIMPIQLKN
ncbi:DNA polymerase III subunit beta [Ruminococcus sp.]|uniref:DNA polymerase III subunit beta n=1 Tax=Ruminococcus sp. TaxID=41978 RepID=UPI001B40ACD0|nr:DNA polymerase III subunit beta [Ruminococcus sp.]MBP5431851.1 DNA polymerase III subunit beta [Ruminococcus sp.]